MSDLVPARHAQALGRMNALPVMILMQPQKFLVILVYACATQGSMTLTIQMA